VRSACIDIGSNTTRLLVAERHDGGLRAVLERRMFVPLVPGLDGGIGAETIGVLAAVVAAHAAAARECGVQRVQAVATAAIRAAANGEALCAAIAREAGLAVRVLGDEEEARLAFAGATRTLADPPGGTVGVVDVGGGSCELVTGSVTGGMEWFASVPIGSGVLTEGEALGDPPSAAEVARMRARADANFAALGAPQPAVAYAVGGSATSLRRLCGDELSTATLDEALALLCRRPVRDVADDLALARERVRLLPAGLVLLGAAVRAFGGVALQVARGGLREGVVLEDLAGKAPT
jgi:exopolyphosphatase / guanosine-5'-triphosphate,3'-diphosphate pyrophosphatase